LIGSTPYGRKGVLYDGYRAYHSNDAGEALCWIAPTRTMNPCFDQQLIDEEMVKDEPRARAEYLAVFRRDIETFVSIEAIQACVSSGVLERPPLSDIRYHAFVDPSGGSSDSMTLAVAHKEGDGVVLDAVREVKPPFSPESIVVEFSALLKSYRVGSVKGDRYAGEWPREQFRKCGVDYLPADRNKSELYGALCRC
jgi:hypothetical protein